MLYTFLFFPVIFVVWAMGNKAVCGPEIQGKGQEVQPADLSQQAMYSLFGIVLYKRTATTTNLASNEFKIVNL